VNILGSATITGVTEFPFMVGFDYGRYSSDVDIADNAAIVVAQNVRAIRSDVTRSGRRSPDK